MVSDPNFQFPQLANQRGKTVTVTDASDSPRSPDTTVEPGATPTAQAVAIVPEEPSLRSGAGESLTIDLSCECHSVPDAITMCSPAS